MAFKLGALLMICAQICATFANPPPCTCTRNLAPVCGSDGVTYNNQCLLECAASRGRIEITVAKEGPCEGGAQETQDDCGPCILLYQPVCGSDGQTYGNDCALNCQKSRFNPSLTVQHTGACKEPGTPNCVCTDVNSPVCGSDGNTYNNQCLLNCKTTENSMLSIAHFGACSDGVQVARPKFE